MHRRTPRRRIFLSYPEAGVDREWLRAFAQSLKKHGADVWFDEFAVKPGEPLLEPMERALRSSDTIVFLMTPGSANRPDVHFEIGAGLAGGKRMVAILPKDMDPSLLPQPLRTRRFLSQCSPEQAAAELVSEPSPTDKT
jgi:hypothetical protein